MTEGLPEQEQNERPPSPFEQVMEFARLSAREREICAACTPENKSSLIEWYVSQQELARQSPDSRAGIVLDIKAGVMQYLIAKDMEQRQEAFDRLQQAREAAMGDGQDDLSVMADAAMDMLDAI